MPSLEPDHHDPQPPARSAPASHAPDVTSAGPAYGRSLDDRYWRSLDDWADTPEFRAWLEAEFPQEADVGNLTNTRRHFLKLMGASVSLAGLVGCRRWPREKIAPYAHRPMDRTPGRTERFATTWELAGVGQPLLVTSYDGRPIKVEGNPQHPASRGAANLWAQASILDMYDPDRSRFPVERTRPATEATAATEAVRSLADFESFARDHFAASRDKQGAGLAVLAERTSSPSLARLEARFRKLYPKARWCVYEPSDPAGWDRGPLAAPVRSVLHLDRAKVIACFDADVLGTHPDAVRHARDFADGRASAAQGHMNRLYVAENTYTTTGAMADHRAAVPRSQIMRLVGALAARLGLVPDVPEELPEPQAAFVRQLARDLREHGPHALVVAGPAQPDEVHTLCHLINESLGAIGRTVTLTRGPEPTIHGTRRDLRELAGLMEEGDIQTLVILGGNPIYNMPADVVFHEALAKVETAIHLSLYDNETSRACHWHLPRAHYLEAWGDVRAWDGTVSVAQPLIEPLYNGVSAIELLAMITDEGSRAGYDIVRETFKPMLAGIPMLTGEDFETAWRRVLHDGLLGDSASPAIAMSKPDATGMEALRASLRQEPPGAPGLFELTFEPDRSVFDGRFANNGWLQEAPDSLTKLTWDNAALISPPDADRMHLRTGDVVRITTADGAVEMPIYVLPGQAQGSVALPLGYGRSMAGRIGNGVGVNVYPLRTTSGSTAVTHVTTKAAGLTMIKLPRTYKLACTQDHHAIDRVGFNARRARARHLVREATLAEFTAEPDFAKHAVHTPPMTQLWEAPVDFNDHRWAMAIDLNRCIGCNACVLACQAENNIPIVGKEEVALGRAMHWLRVDRYFRGGPDEPSPAVVHMPMTCHHCENAPCEQVCPVAATVHDTEGLNTMVYNRCIGTRYCSNNCPYKVRRFNYYDYHSLRPDDPRKPWLGMPDSQQQHQVDEVRRLGFNPEVSVRMRGVMEKCTFCVQRIMAAKIDAKNQRRPIADGEIVPACAQTCPTRAIIFGDLNDPASAIRKAFENPRSYAVLKELNVRPRLNYLARLRNPAESAEHETDETNEGKRELHLDDSQQEHTV